MTLYGFSRRISVCLVPALSFVLLTASGIVGCGSSSSFTSPHTIILDLTSKQLAVGASSQILVQLTLANGSQQNVANQATYVSSNPSVAIVNSSGKITGLVPGTAIITVTYQAQSATVGITITAPTPSALSLASTTGTLTVGAATQLQATATNTDGGRADVTASSTFTSSSSAVASVNPSGFVTAVAVGIATITATYEGKAATVAITVTAPNTVTGGPVTGGPVTSGPVTGGPVADVPVTVESLSVEAASLDVAKGMTQQLKTTATMTDGTTVDVTDQAAYTSSVSSTAAVSTSGMVTGISTGTVVITAVYQGQSGTATITVTAAAATSIALTSSSNSVAAGQSVQLRTNAAYGDKTIANVTSSATYNSSNTAAARVNASGVVTGVARGTAIITASYEGKTATTTIAVSAAPPVMVSIVINPGSPQLANGTTKQLQALASFSDGSLRDVTRTAKWSTSSSVVDLSATGLVTAIGRGSARIIAAEFGVSGAENLTVTGATLKSFFLSPTNPTIAAGLTLRPSGIGVFTDGSKQDITNQLTFASGSPSIVKVASPGVLSGISLGSATITATTNAAMGAKTTSVSFKVNTASLQSITIFPATFSVVQGRSQQMVAMGAFSDGSSRDITQSVTWVSSNPNAAIVNAQGVLTALNPGTIRLVATAVVAQTAPATITEIRGVLISLATAPKL
jgi:trimeric autotransporter adhesin